MEFLAKCLLDVKRFMQTAFHRPHFPLVESSMPWHSKGYEFPLTLILVKNNANCWVITEISKECLISHQVEPIILNHRHGAVSVCSKPEKGMDKGFCTQIRSHFLLNCFSSCRSEQQIYALIGMLSLVFLSMIAPVKSTNVVSKDEDVLLVST